MTKRGAVAATIAAATDTARAVKHTLQSWALHIVAEIAKHNNDGATAFLNDPAPFVTPPAGVKPLTTAQLCNLFNVAMSMVDVGLTMPTDAQKEKVWDDEVFKRGMELAKGRTVTARPWVNKTYQPLKIIGKDSPRSFYTGLTEAARTGLLSDVDSKQFAGLEGDDLRDALREWFYSVVGDGKDGKLLTGSKDRPGVLASSYQSVAIREGLPPSNGKRRRGKRAETTAESLLKEYGG